VVSAFLTVNNNAAEQWAQLRRCGLRVPAATTLTMIIDHEGQTS